jgi:hypothetical protein
MEMSMNVDDCIDILINVDELRARSKVEGLLSNKGLHRSLHLQCREIAFATTGSSITITHDTLSPQTFIYGLALE